MSSTRRFLVGLGALCLAACANGAEPGLDSGTPVDASRRDASLRDAGRSDAGRRDGGALPEDAAIDDAGGAVDGGASRDGGGSVDGGGPRDGGPRDGGPRDGGASAAWQWASGATATSFYAGGACTSSGDYDAPRAVGAPNCANCTDYCMPIGATPCSWFPGTPATNSLTATFATPIPATSVVLHLTYTAPPGDVTEVAVAPTAAGPFTPLGTGTSVVGACATPRDADDWTLTYTASGTAMVGAVRVTMRSYDSGVDAIGIR